MSIIKFLARNKIRLSTGINLLSITTGIIGYLTFAKVWVGTFVFYGIPPLLVYISVPVLYVFGCWAIGYVYEKKKLFAEEFSFSNTVLNPEIAQLSKDVKLIKKKLEIEE